jgi:hypothetical protein
MLAASRVGTRLAVVAQRPAMQDIVYDREAGAVVSTPTVTNAILDALALLGVSDVPMPATPERVWRAIHEQAAR